MHANIAALPKPRAPTNDLASVALDSASFAHPIEKQTASVLASVAMGARLRANTLETPIPAHVAADSALPAYRMCHVTCSRMANGVVSISQSSSRRRSWSFD